MTKIINNHCSGVKEDKLKEECGVFGIFANKNIELENLMYQGLSALQHRGQESAGVVVSNGTKIYCHKDMGLVSQVFGKSNLSHINGKIAIGHVRYSTSGDSSRKNAQPILGNSKYGKIAVAHNGNLINSDKISNVLKGEGFKFNTTADSEVILKLIEREFNIQGKYIGTHIENTLKYIQGAYSFILLTTNSLIGVRDPMGIRPLSIGKINEVYIICSETCALSSLGAEFVRDIQPGEMVIINDEGIKSIKFSNSIDSAVCAFEYIYFAREDSTIDGVNVYNSRVTAGKKLYECHPAKGDVVIGVPDSGIPAAIGYSKASGIPYGVGFVRNKYAVRSFILPDQTLRENMINIKLTPLAHEIKGKRVIVVDDSIVRGTSSKKIVAALFKNGAKEVHFRIASPPIKHCCYLGVDTPQCKELIAAYKSLEEIRKEIGADTLEYLQIEEFLKNFPFEKGLCTGCFNDKYPM